MPHIKSSLRDYWCSYSHWIEEVIASHYNKDIQAVQNEIDATDLGLGDVKIPFDLIKKIGEEPEVKSADFKKIVNSYFKPKIEAIGFKGRDNKFYKKCNGYTATLNFLRYYRYGQGFHVEMLIKLNEIKYPPYFKNFSSGRALKFCEFSKQLAPINVSHWAWPYDNNEENTKLLLDDVLKLLSTKGKEYFDQFIEVKKVVDKIKHSDDNSWDKYYSDIGYPSRFRDFNFSNLHNCYFLFAFYKNMNNKKLAVYYAEKGLGFIKNYKDIYTPEAFQESFENYINGVL